MKENKLKLFYKILGNCFFSHYLYVVLKRKPLKIENMDAKELLTQFFSRRKIDERFPKYGKAFISEKQCVWLLKMMHQETGRRFMHNMANTYSAVHYSNIREIDQYGFFASFEENGKTEKYYISFPRCYVVGYRFVHYSLYNDETSDWVVEIAKSALDLDKWNEYLLPLTKWKRSIEINRC